MTVCRAVLGSFALLLLILPGAALAQSGGADRSGELRAAASRGDAAAVRKLVEARVPLDGKDDRGQTALLLAVAGGHNEAARALIDAGADINAVAANMDTPWMLAGALGRAEMLAQMLPKGPNYSLRNRFGGNALIPACERGHVEAVEVLLKSKIPIDHINNLGWTCLLEIVILGSDGPRHVKVLEMVLAAGASVSIADKDGVTPLQHARRRGFKELAKRLEAKGAK